MFGLRPAREGLDDDHSAAAAWAWMLCCFLLVGLGAGVVGLGTGSLDGINGNYWCQREQFAGARDVGGTLTAVEHSIITDAVETSGQHMHQEAADELAGRERQAAPSARLGAASGD